MPNMNWSNSYIKIRILSSCERLLLIDIWIINLCSYWHKFPLDSNLMGRITFSKCREFVLRETGILCWKTEMYSNISEISSIIILVQVNFKFESRKTSLKRYSLIKLKCFQQLLHMFLIRVFTRKGNPWCNSCRTKT